MAWAHQAMRPDLDHLRRAVSLEGSDSSDFDLNGAVDLPEGRTLRNAAVLIPVIGQGAELQVILTKRSPRLKHHPGQIAFPGGKQDAGDPTLIATALREAQEEISLPPGNVDILGVLPSHETVTGFSVTPVLGHIRDDFRPVNDPSEVAEIFRVPLSHVTDPARFAIQSRYWRRQRRYYYTVPFGPYYIWGATARILRGLADRLTS